MAMYEEFKKRYDKCQAEEAERKKQLDRMSNWRLLVFLAGAVASVLLFLETNVVYGFLSLVVWLAMFIWLIARHRKMSAELKKVSCRVVINREYMDRMGSGWMDFSDCGQEFANSANPYTGDLDIFGPKSMFQWINIAKTYYGRVALKNLLEGPDKSIAAIQMRQSALRELSKKLDFCQGLQSEGMLSKGVENNPQKLLEYAEDQTARFKNKKLQNLFYVLPASVILTFTLWLLGSPIPLFLPLLLLVTQMIIFAAGYMRNSEIANAVYGLKKHLGAYANLLRLIESEGFENEYLCGLRGKLFTGNELGAGSDAKMHGPDLDKRMRGFDGKGEAASTSLRRLENITNAVDIKYSTVLYFILNIFTLWDYHCVFALEEWKSHYGKNARQWLETVGQMEGLSSLAVVGHMYPEWVYPTLSQSGLKFVAKGIGHPLIAKNVCVRNDFEISRGACVITGSNMSGKTTLLRTVGSNLVLAYAGAPVFAEKLECAVMDIFTSMRVHDDLGSGISTFYAELLRVKMIIEHARKGLPMIYLIDEIFMGTNSLDRTTGARSVLKNLNRGWIIGLISTHDFELCDLEKEKGTNVKNYHFTETYSNNEIMFDYRLRPGRSRTRNARHLMKMVGIELEE